MSDSRVNSRAAASKPAYDPTLLRPFYFAELIFKVPGRKCHDFALNKPAFFSALHRHSCLLLSFELCIDPGTRQALGCMSLPRS
eukprot:985322-Pelagomonas_calceolata.AAC.2